MVSIVAVTVEEQANATKEIADNVSQASQGIQEVNENVAQASSVTREVAADIAEVGQSSNEINTSSTQVNTSAGELSELGEKLTGIVNQFKVYKQSRLQRVPGEFLGRVRVTLQGRSRQEKRR